MYEIGIRPDWWKLEPAADSDTWSAIQQAIERNDPHCRGVVVLGLAGSEDSLLRSFAAAAPFQIVKGFAVGRTVWAEVARLWLTGRIDHSQALDMIAARFARLVQGWRAARPRLAAAGN